MRTLALDAVKFKARDAERATRVFGSQAWRPIYERRRHEELSASDARNEYLNLMRWRLERDLGYRSTHPLELKNTQGTSVYHMVFATDNEAGEKIMSDLYTRAAREIPQMQKEARDQKSGQLSFDTPGDALPDGPTYEYRPPWQPPTD
jgi:hypothetical protein